MDNNIRFQEELEMLVQDFGKGDQEGVKTALNLSQELFDCVSPAHQTQIADAFEVNPTVITTFMRFNKSLKESIVKYEIIFCSGPRCAKNGSVRILNVITEALGIKINETTPDGKIRLLTQNCFKQCQAGPNLKINGKFHHYVNPEKAQELIKQVLDDTLK